MLSNEETCVNILKIIRVSTKDSGTYTCHAFQSVTGWPDFPHVQVITSNLVHIKKIIIIIFKLFL